MPDALQVCHPIPVILGPGDLTEVSVTVKAPALLFGILIGEPALELCAVSVNARPLPHAMIRLVDATRFAGLPAALVPAGGLIAVVVKAPVRVSAELEVLVWQDAHASTMLERAGARALGVA